MTAKAPPKRGERRIVQRRWLDERPIRMPEEWPDVEHFYPWFCRAMRRAWDIHPKQLGMAAGISPNKLQEWERREFKPLDEPVFRSMLSTALARLVEPRARLLALAAKEFLRP